MLDLNRVSGVSLACRKCVGADGADGDRSGKMIMADLCACWTWLIHCLFALSRV